MPWDLLPFINKQKCVIMFIVLVCPQTAEVSACEGVLIIVTFVCRRETLYHN